MNWIRLRKKCRDKKILLVDFHDTVMFRKIHSSQLARAWDRCVCEKLDIPAGLLSELRKKVIRDFGVEECAIPYRELMKGVYSALDDAIRKRFCEEEFFELAFQADLYLDMGTQYPNRRMVKFLQKMKADGKKIILISDYYLTGACYKTFLEYYHLDGLFDRSYCSADYGETKRNGGLYGIVLGDYKDADRSDIIMIGDSKISDYERARQQGIDAWRYFPFMHKLHTNWWKIRKIDFKKKGARFIYSKSYKNTLFGEYALNLYYFSEKLYRNLKSSEAWEVIFLSRGGYLLKELFDRYQEFCIRKSDVIETSYVKNSRMVNQLAKENREDRELLKELLMRHVRDGKLFLVDEGWYAHSQIIMSEILGGGGAGNVWAVSRSYEE